MPAHRFRCNTPQEDDRASDRTYTSILSVLKLDFVGCFVANVFCVSDHDTVSVVIIVEFLNDVFL